MYMFTRQTRLSGGNETAGVEWAQSIAATVTDVIGREISLWGNVYSPGSGTVSWTGWFEDLVSLERAADSVAGDPRMERLTNAATKYTEGGFDDNLVGLVHGGPPPASITYVTGVVSVAAPGSARRALAAGVEIAQKAEAITGVPMLFGRSRTGAVRQVNWFTGFESVAAMEQADIAQAGDPSWLELLDSTKDWFLADTNLPRATIYRKLG